MKYVKQFAIIMAVCLVGEAVEALVPLPVPGNVYGMVLMFILLCLKVVRVEQVKDVAGFLIAIMSIFFVPAGVGLISAWPMERSLLIAAIIAVCGLTLVVMGVSGHVTQLVQRVLGGRSTETEDAHE
ncbi:MAG: CidA/LrgA family protein [Propionibacteriaceae bacterium]|jgi:holin-like protein|nr:CidA/LrgA family protein [Propionibacteriaceae bacterium]